MALPIVAVVGGGMITHDQILPSLYELQRLGEIGEILVCAQHGRTLHELAASTTIGTAFPKSSFVAWPPMDSDPDAKHPELYKEMFATLPAGSVAIIALPDQLHYEAVMSALAHDLHVVCVKPLVLTHDDALKIDAEAAKRGLFVGVEYHKRFDDRSLIARRRYQAGMFGELKLGTATLMEKWYYRHSKFQNWFHSEYSDAFTYIGCHYVDLVHFITGLLPKSVSVYGIKDKFPNGKEGYLWTDARVIWNNGACLNLQNSLSFPDAAPGSNTQGMVLYFSDAKKDVGGYLAHDDQYRGMSYAYTTPPTGLGTTAYHEPSTEYFQYLDVGEQTLLPTGYGYRSVARLVEACKVVEDAGAGSDRSAALADRQAARKQISDRGVLATPANSSFNELVVEAGRVSLLSGGREVEIHYDEPARVTPRVWE